jgi:hypothetical protein
MKFTEFLKEKYENLTWKREDKLESEPIRLVTEQEGILSGDEDYDERPHRKDRKGKEEKPQKIFKPGDVLVLVDSKKSSIPQDAYDFLMTYKTFTVKKVNDKGKIDLGCRISKNTPEGGVEKIYMFGTNRFELASGEKAPTTADAPIGGIKPLEEAPETAAPTATSTEAPKPITMADFEDIGSEGKW